MRIASVRLGIVPNKTPNAGATYIKVPKRKFARTWLETEEVYKDCIPSDWHLVSILTEYE